MSTACLIGRPTGAAAMRAVYCHCDGNPSAMVPVLRRLVLDTFGGDPSAAIGYLFAYSDLGYWSSLTGSGDARSSAMRADTADGALHKRTAGRWPGDVDIYHDNSDCRHAVLEYRDGRYLDGALLRWPQQWLYLVYPQVLAVVRYVPPTERLGNPAPLGLNCQPLPWSERVDSGELLAVEQRANHRVRTFLATPARTVAGRSPTSPFLTPEVTQ